MDGAGSTTGEPDPRLADNARLDGHGHRGRGAGRSNVRRDPVVAWWQIHCTEPATPISDQASVGWAGQANGCPIPVPAEGPGQMAPQVSQAGRVLPGQGRGGGCLRKDLADGGVGQFSTR